MTPPPQTVGRLTAEDCAALDDLDLHWETTWDFLARDGLWTGRRSDGSRTFTATSPHELHQLISAGHTDDPIPHHCILTSTVPGRSPQTAPDGLT
jgi:hypothetical protein